MFSMSNEKKDKFTLLEGHACQLNGNKCDQTRVKGAPRRIQYIQSIASAFKSYQAYPIKFTQGAYLLSIGW